MNFSRGPRRGAIAAAIASVVLGTSLGTGPASAETKTFHDDPDDSGAITDIQRVKVDYGRTNLKVVVKHIALDFNPRSVRSEWLFVDTSTKRPGPEFKVALSLLSGQSKIRAARNWQPVGKSLSCAEAKISQKYATTVYRLSPGCLGGTKRARVAVRSVGFFYDENRTITDWYDGRRVFTPWVTKG